MSSSLQLMKISNAEVWGTELYDHTTPSTFFNDENVNLADKPEMKQVVEELRKMLQAGWRSALPPTGPNDI